MDIVYAIGEAIHLLHSGVHSPCYAENVAKGRQDKPLEDVIIVECGELPLDLEVDEEGNQVPLHAEL